MTDHGLIPMLVKWLQDMESHIKDTLSADRKKHSHATKDATDKLESTVHELESRCEQRIQNTTASAARSMAALKGRYSKEIKKAKADAERAARDINETVERTKVACNQIFKECTEMASQIRKLHTELTHATEITLSECSILKTITKTTEIAEGDTLVVAYDPDTYRNHEEACALIQSSIIGRFGRLMNVQCMAIPDYAKVMDAKGREVHALRKAKKGSTNGAQG